jgi:hypothetical protein
MYNPQLLDNIRGIWKPPISCASPSCDGVGKIGDLTAGCNCFGALVCWDLLRLDFRRGNDGLALPLLPLATTDCRLLLPLVLLLTPGRQEDSVEPVEGVPELPCRLCKGRCKFEGCSADFSADRFGPVRIGGDGGN